MTAGRLRVALICPPAKSPTASPVIYGGELHIQQLVQYLAEQTIEVDIFASRTGHSHDGFRTRYFSNSSSFHPIAHQFAGDSADADLINARFFAEALSSHPEFRSRKFDVIHTHHWKATLVLPFVHRKWPRCATVHTPHLLANAKALHTGARLPSQILKWEQQILPTVDRLIALTSAERDDIATTCPAVDMARVAVIPNGFDHLSLSTTQPACPQQEVVRLVSVGRIAQQKNWLFLLEVIREAKKCYYPWHLTLLGGSYEADYENELRGFIDRYNLHQNVTMPGYVEQDTVRKSLANSHVYIHAATYESQGIAIGEAMCHGLPCVITDSMGIRDFFQHGVHGAIVNNPHQAFSAVRMLIEQPTLYQRIATENRTVRQRFTWQQAMTRTIAAYYATVTQRHDTSLTGTAFRQRIAA